MSDQDQPYGEPEIADAHGARQMSARELIGELAKHNPEEPVVITSSDAGTFHISVARGVVFEALGHFHAIELIADEHDLFEDELGPEGDD